MNFDDKRMADAFTMFLAEYRARIAREISCGTQPAQSLQPKDDPAFWRVPKIDQGRGRGMDR
jgi:hypothetical protein